MDILDLLKHGDFAGLTSLLNKGVDVNLFCIENKTDIIVESIVRDNYFMFERSLKNFDVNKNKFKYLHHAVRNENPDYLIKLIEKYKLNNKELNEIDEEHNNLLHTVFLRRNLNLKIINIINDLNINWNEENNKGLSQIKILLKSFYEKPKDVVEFLIKNKKELIKKLFDTHVLDDLLMDENWKNINQSFIKGILSE